LSETVLKRGPPIPEESFSQGAARSRPLWLPNRPANTGQDQPEGI
jgi:hypothetical protein